MDLDGAPYGGALYPVESIMGGRTFVKFYLDVGIRDVVRDPLQQAKMRDWLGLAGISPPSVPMIQREQQFVERLHAYTLPRSAAPNSRARDLVDMVLLIQSRTLESSRVVQALQATFDLRATHPVPKALDPPPEEWSAPFARLAAECRLELSAYEALRAPGGILRDSRRPARTLRLLPDVAERAILSSPVGINYFASVSAPWNTLCFTWGASRDSASIQPPASGSLPWRATSSHRRNPQSARTQDCHRRELHRQPSRQPAALSQAYPAAPETRT